MGKTYRCENVVQLAFAVLLQAVKDYVKLRELGIVKGTEIAEWRFYRKYSNGAPNHPLNFHDASDVRSLIYFLRERPLDDYCAYLGFPPCRLRAAIGIVPGKSKLLKLDDIEHLEAQATGRRYAENFGVRYQEKKPSKNGRKK